MNLSGAITLISMIVAVSTAVAADSVDVGSVCDQAGDDSARDYAASYGNPTSYPTSALATGAAADMPAALLAFCKSIGHGDGCLAQAPWILMNSSRTEVRVGMFLVQQYLVNQFLHRTTYASGDYNAVLSEASSAPAQYTTGTAAYVKGVISSISNDANNKIDIQLQRFKPYVDGACFIFLDPGCPTALQDILTLAKVGTITTSIDGTGVTYLTALSAVQTLFSDPRYVQGLAIAALNIQQKAVSAQNGVLPKSDFFSDIKSGYLQAGFDDPTATDMAFTYMAYYGARGASVEYTSLLANSENYPILVSSYIISGAAGVLDAFTYSSGHPYSLPASESTHCNFGRPYHFWLSAYLARQLVLDGNPERSSVIAVHVFGVGYELAAGTVTRVPYLALTRAPNDPADNATRLNIAMDDAGAKLGAAIGAGSTPPITNIDSRISLLVSEAGPFTPISTTQAEDLFTNDFVMFAIDWNSIFHPDDGFLFLEF